MTSYTHNDQTAAPQPDKTEPIEGDLASDQVTVKLQADSKLHQV